ncbi:MAG: hypothetical protein GW886_11635 [Rhodobacterales bacterium]|nr:hypothetical protein [Rhodobacterales bacterium]NCT11780.1 hypothetical protein [Rhodobacterales bacterium]
MVEALFQGITQDMAGALATLDRTGEDDAVGVTTRTDDLWFDIDMNGRRGACEGVLDVAGLGRGGGSGAPLNGVSVRFDTADAAWLAAYAHLLSGLPETVLAFHPAEAIARVTEGRAAMAALDGVLRGDVLIPHWMPGSTWSS